MINSSSPQDVAFIVAAAKKAKTIWKNLPLEKRLVLLEELYQLFQAKQESIATIITKEIGKPITQSRGEVSFFQTYNRWMLDHAKEILSPEIIKQDNVSVHTLYYEPIGVTAIILPWNSPFGMFSWKLFSNLLVGNVVVIKHAEQSIRTAGMLDELVKNVGLPDGVYSQIYGDGTVGQKLIEQNIDQVCFTGSTLTGKVIKKSLGDRIVPVHLELGGSNPAIVFEDADIPSTATRILSGRFVNNGQNCDAIKRVIIHERIKNQLLSELTQLLQGKIVGDPSNEDTYFGPLVSVSQKQIAETQLSDAIKNGAKIEVQLDIPQSLSVKYFSPVILSNIQQTMKIWNEETFAPILPIITFTNTDEAIQLANDTKFGLGATVFTKDKKNFNTVAKQLDCGNVEMNSIYQWIPENPFGGYKESGLGREQGVQGMRELCQTKVVSEEIK